MRRQLRRGFDGTPFLRSGAYTQGRATGEIDAETINSLRSFLASYRGRFGFLVDMKRKAAKDPAWPTNKEAWGTLNSIRQDPKLSARYNAIVRGS